MCGIFGTVNKNGVVDAEKSFRRTQMLNHRGPDFCGHYSRNNVFLGHTRLSILDLSPAGNQPFGDERAQLVFNGEIYNWRQLSAEHLSDQELHSKSDTEVLFLLLRKMGNACLPLLDGMFALAYYDIISDKLTLARDTVGIKPLYFVDGTTFEFSSEIKNLDYKPDLHRLKEYLIFGRFGEDFLPFENVREVLPGCYLEFDCTTGNWSQSAYQEAESLISEARHEELSRSANLVDQLDALLQRSVAMHEQSDAPIGFLCSGGLDSSLITAMAASRHPDVSIYHADFEGVGRELGFAEQVAHHVKAPLRKTTMTKGGFWELLPQVTYALDLPVQHPHSLSLCLIARQAQADGLKVLLAGEGADELFAGYWFYPSYRRSLSGDIRQSTTRKLLGKIMRRSLRKLQPDPDPYWFFSEFSPAFQRHAHVGFGDAYSLSEPIQSLSLVGQNFKAWRRWQQAVEAFSWMADRREASVLSYQLFYMRYHLQPLLHRLDRMLMIHSIEGRVPFLENDLMRFALNLGTASKIQGNDTKRIVKEVAVRYLPANLVNRRKVGFTVPFHSYVSKFPKILDGGFVSEWTGLSKTELVAWCNGDMNQLYRLISIEVWGRIFVYGVPWTDIKVDFD